jgi:hypothetical protein
MLSIPTVIFYSMTIECGLTLAVELFSLNTGDKKMEEKGLGIAHFPEHDASDFI